jgi:hypothetical protein
MISEYELIYIIIGIIYGVVLTSTIYLFFNWIGVKENEQA